jgi:acetate kinase
MVRILVINSGSSSLKYTLFDMEDESVLFEGAIERISLEEGRHSFHAAGEKQTVRKEDLADHGQALDAMLDTLTTKMPGSVDRIAAVTHRVGHGGKYRDAVRITPDVVAEIRRMTPMIPLHHPAMVEEIEECQVRMPDAVHVAVFDTWFHSTIPDKAAVYGLPYRYFAEKGYRRTGFHGNSHAYVSAKAAEHLGRAIEDLKIITCHLGNGASVCAIHAGHSVDTSLGMTSLEGLIMGTRSGDVDPGLIPVIMKEDNLTPDEMIDMLYRESGLKGLSGVSSDMRDIEAAAEAGEARSMLALDAFCYRVKRYIGAMLMVLGRCDALVFTGGIGCNGSLVRKKVLEGAEDLGFSLDENQNVTDCSVESELVMDIGAPGSKARILVVRTFEELMMARQCVRALQTE